MHYALGQTLYELDYRAFLLHKLVELSAFVLGHQHKSVFHVLNEQFCERYLVGHLLDWRHRLANLALDRRVCGRRLESDY